MQKEFFAACMHTQKKKALSLLFFSITLKRKKERKKKKKKNTGTFPAPLFACVCSYVGNGALMYKSALRFVYREHPVIITWAGITYV